MLLEARAEADLANDESHRLAMSGTFRGMNDDEHLHPSFLAETKIAEEYDPRKQAYVGTLEKSGRNGFALGVAPNNSRPLQPIESGSPNRLGGSASALGSPAPDSKEVQRSSPHSPRAAQKTKGEQVFLSHGSPDFVHEDQHVLFDAYINSEGADIHKAFVDGKQSVKDLKSKGRDASTAVNAAKASIDDLQRKMEVRKESRIELLRRNGFKATEAEEIVDEEELSLMRDLKEVKRSYKAAYESFQRYKMLAAEAANRTEKAKTALGTGFIAWSTRMLEPDLDPESSDGNESLDTLDNQENFDRMEAQRVLSRYPGFTNKLPTEI